MSDGTPIPIRRPDQEPRWLIWSLRFAAYAIPLGFLLYVLYWNFLPFGYEKTFTIDVGSPGDTSGEFHLEPSRDLSERKTAPDGTTYRELNGIAYAVFKPKAVLKNAQITVSVEGEGVSIIPPVIDFDPDSVAWDYAWDFSKTDGEERSNILQNVGMSTSGPQELGGNAYPFDGCMYFDGKSRLELPDSADMFEEGPFTVYAEWTPDNAENNYQEITGHFNWELLQDKDFVRFLVGRMDDSTGPFHSIQYSIGPNFFNNKHSALAIYSPVVASSTEKGWIGLYVDNVFAGRTYFGSEVIWKGYTEENLSLGWTKHNKEKEPHYEGCLFQVDFRYGALSSSKTSLSRFNGIELRTPIEASATSSLVSIKINVH